MSLPPAEPQAGPWSAVALADLAGRLLEGSERARQRPWVVAIDGRGGAGKSSLAETLLPHLQPAAVVRTDDLAWHEPLFGWGHHLAHVLEMVHRGEAVSFRPPAWQQRGRAGSIDVPAGLRAVIVEGSGADQEVFAHLIDRTIWVQADHGEAEKRGIARDEATGVNGDEEQARRFWHGWQEQELPFFASEQPWLRAAVIVAGTPVISLGPGEVACAPAFGQGG